ncbi:MAG: asparagine synthase (glutamine-hydrolyzing) [Terriglobales bacterium]
MCGVFGAVNLEGVFDGRSFEQFVELTDMVSYRGPDDSGYLALSLRQNGLENPDSFDVFLGSRRLSIQDLSPAGHQPMTDGEGCWITFNGEIFNFLELRAELKALGHRFKTRTDTEVILHIYAQYGERGFEKLNGMWAFAIVDLARKAVVLSRDRFSIKPLYLLERERGRMYFSSEIKQLLPLLGKRELNADVMAAFLSQGLLDHTADTFVRGIKKLPPRMNLVVSLSDESLSYSSYWEFEPPSSVKSNNSIDEFRELLVDSTKIRLRSDVPVGLLLSGGLDSSSLAAACSRVSECKVKAYSVVSKHSESSEEAYIDAVSDGLNLAIHKLSLQDRDATKALEEVLYHNDEPFAGFSVLAQYRILQTIKQQGGAIVLLSGQGGDEILLGYLKFYFFNLRALIRGHSYGKAMAEVLLSLIRRTVIGQFRIKEAKRFIPFLKNSGVRYLRHQKAAVPVWEFADMRQRQILDIERYSVPALTHYEDRNAGAHSLEIRHPFLDHRLVNFALNLPVEKKLRGGWTKRILRETFSELPAQVRWRRRKGYFSVPEESWLRRDLKEFVCASFKNSLLEDLGFLDKKAFLNAYNAFRQHHPTIGSSDISRTLIAELWTQKFLRCAGSNASSARENHFVASR